MSRLAPSRVLHLRAIILVMIVLATAGACDGAARAARDRGPVVIDDFGDSVPTQPAAQRIISLNPVTTELLFTMGAGPRLVGRSRWDGWPLAALEVPEVGDAMQPNVEAILARRPDLVVLYASPSNRTAATRLQEAGVRTLAVRTDAISDLTRIATALGALIGDSLAGARAVDSTMRTIDSVRALTALTDARPSVAWIVWDDPLIVIGGGSYRSELLAAAGATNAFADIAAPSPQLSIEVLVQRDPDVLIVGTRMAERFAEDARWRRLRAVRERRLIFPDTGIVGRPGVRMGEAARHLRELVRPLVRVAPR
ncbi:MAG: hypothetical protein RL625_1456 [Gemmatimonadota bacterium]